MPAAVVSIDAKRRGYWSLLEVAQPGRPLLPYGILLADQDTGDVSIKLRDTSCFDELDEQDSDYLAELGHDLKIKASQMRGPGLFAWMEDTLSNFLRISDREPIAFNHPRSAVNRLFDEHVDSTVRRYITHLPLYGLRAAATKFGEAMEASEEAWVRAPGNLRLTDGMFVACVVGRSMEPLIPDGSACIFRAPVTGSRNLRHLLIEKFDETDFASRYTVKRYARRGPRDESAERETPIRLEPLNPEFEAFELTSDKFRVVAEFVQVLES
jgi:SOS-response transcriptional repressor LexA